MTICIIFLLLYMVNTESKDEREREAMQNHKYFIILCGFVGNFDYNRLIS